MLIICDKRLPAEAKQKLSKYGKIFELSSENIVYSAISGHPDIFITQLTDKLIVAPNAPQDLFAFLNQHSIKYIKGEKSLGAKYPETAIYNSFCNKRYFIHKQNITDNSVFENLQLQKIVNVSQAYTRCNLVSLGEKAYLTSDKSIYKVLNDLGEDVLFINSEEIKLEGFKNGFFGGVCGVLDNKIIVSGSLDYHSQNLEITNFLKKYNFDSIELYSGPLFDGGSIVFIENKHFSI